MTLLLPDEQRCGKQTPALLHRPPGGVNHDAAQVAIELADRYDILLGDAQRFSLEVGMAETDDWRWAARTYAEAKPRQAGGKNNTLEAREVAGVTELGELLVLHTAHEFPTANEAFHRMEATLMNYDDLRAKVDRPRYANDEKGFDFLNGARIRYRSRTKGAGRGFAEADLIVLDEAQNILDVHMQALGPTGAANPNSQTWACGTGGFSWSTFWWRLRRRALKGMAGADVGPFGWVEHTAQHVTLRDDGLIELVNPQDVLDIDAWVEAMPRLGDGLVTYETVMELYELLGERAFGVEMLMLWEPEPSSDAGGPIDPRHWATLAEKRDDSDEFPKITGNVKVGFAVSGDETWATFAGAGTRADGCVQVEVTDRFPMNMPNLEQTVTTRAKELSDRWGGVLVRSTGPSASFIKPMKAAGVNVVEVPSTEYARSTGAFIRLANSADARLRHLGNRWLDRAVQDCRTRPSADGRVWDIGSTETDTSPLEAGTLAVGGVPDDVASAQDMFVI